MNFVRNTRRYQYQCVNGARLRESNVAPQHMELLANPRQALTEEERLANRARAEEKREQARIRREAEEQAQEQLRNEAIMAEVNRVIEGRIAEIRAEFLNAQINERHQRMEVDDDEVVLRIPEPFEAREIEVVENEAMIGMRGANRMNGMQFFFIYSFGDITLLKF